MYCRNCGNELNVNANFCVYCGYEVKEETVAEISKSNKKRWKTKSTIAGSIVVGMLIIAGVFYFEMDRITVKNDALEAAKHFMEEENYEAAINAYNTAFAKGDNEAEHYLFQAKAYVETGDLYGAQQTLQFGYANTKCEDLLNVEIWGPSQPFDIFLSISEISMTPNVRTKYVFAGDDVEAQYYHYGRVWSKNRYYFDESGRIIGCQVCEYGTDGFGVAEPVFSIISGADLEDTVIYESAGRILCYDFVYSETDKVDVWAWKTKINVETGEVDIIGQEVIVTFEYENDICMSAITKDTKYEFAYDENERVISISDLDKNHLLIAYSSEGDYILSENNADYVWKFDRNGLNTAYYGDLVEEEWRVFAEDNKVSEIYWCEDLAYQFIYDEEDRIIKAIENSFGKQRTIVCTYDSVTKDSEKWYLEYTDWSGETITQILTLDNEGNILELWQENEHIEFTYDESGRCISYMHNQDVIYTIVYDELGRIIDIERNRNN